jgi:cell envelope-related function transcriptional attenuator common domain
MINQKTKINQKKRPLKKQSASRRFYIIIAFIVVLFSIVTFVALFNLILRKTPEVSNDVPFFTNQGGAIIGGDTPNIDKNDKTTVIGNLTYTRRDNVYNFLVAGEALQMQTDAMMVVNYDANTKKVSVMQLPRDTYVNIGRNFHTLNCYFTGEYNTGVKRGADKSTLRTESMASLASLVEQNLDIKIDYWVLVNLAAFRNIVDIIGGVEVDVEHDMFYEDPDQGLFIDLKAGTQILDGNKAEQFVRFRDGYSSADKGRMDAQKIFMTAFLSKLKSSIGVENISKMVQQAVTNVTMSLTPGDCIYFATEFIGVDFNNISMMSLPVSSIYSGGWYEIMNREGALSMINKYFNVYKEDIVDDIFDRNEIFVNKEKAALYEAYKAPSNMVSDGKTAAEINENSIHIPIKTGN